jgi:hypothetical protein
MECLFQVSGSVDNPAAPFYGLADIVVIAIRPKIQEVPLLQSFVAVEAKLTIQTIGHFEIPFPSFTKLAK